MFSIQQTPQSKIIQEYKDKMEEVKKLHSSDTLIDGSSSNNDNDKKVEEDAITIDKDNNDSLRQITDNHTASMIGSSSNNSSNDSSPKSSPNIIAELHSVDGNHSDNSNNTVLASLVDEKNSNNDNNKNDITDIDYDDTTQYYYQYLNKKEKALLKKLRQDIKILNERARKLAEQMDECTSETEKDEVEKRFFEEIDFLVYAEAKLECLIAPKCICDIWDNCYNKDKGDGFYMSLSYYSDNTVYFYKSGGMPKIKIENPNIKTGHDFWKFTDNIEAECVKKRKEGKEYYFENYLLEHNFITKEDLTEKSPTGFEADMRNMDKRIRREYANMDYKI